MSIVLSDCANACLFAHAMFQKQQVGVTKPLRVHVLLLVGVRDALRRVLSLTPCLRKRAAIVVQDLALVYFLALSSNFVKFVVV